MATPLPISDDALRLLLQGGPHDVDAAITIVWTHLGPGLAAYALSILPPAQSGDCKDVVSEAFVKLLNNPRTVKGSVESFLLTIVRNLSLDYCRKHKVRERPIIDPEVLTALSPSMEPSPDQNLMQSEKLHATEKDIKDVFEALDSVARVMGTKENEVAAIMLRIMRGSSRWPTAARIHELLVEKDRTLRESTVKDRRKEVVQKFNLVLEQYGRNEIAD